MRPLYVYFELAGPIDHPEHGVIHQLEVGIKPKDGKPDCARIVVKEKSTSKAIEVASKALTDIVTKYYPKQATA